MPKPSANLLLLLAAVPAPVQADIPFQNGTTRKISLRVEDDKAMNLNAAIIKVQVHRSGTTPKQRGMNIFIVQPSEEDKVERKVFLNQVLARSQFLKVHTFAKGTDLSALRPVDLEPGETAIFYYESPEPLAMAEPNRITLRISSQDRGGPVDERLGLTFDLVSLGNGQVEESLREAPAADLPALQGAGPSHGYVFTRTDGPDPILRLEDPQAKGQCCVIL